MKSKLPTYLAIGLATAFSGGIAAADHHENDSKEMPELIDRNVFFGNPDRASVRISPDGKRIGYLASLDGVLNVFVGPIDDPDAAEAITQDKGRGITNYSFAYDNTHIIYAQDVGGDENNTIFAVNLDTGETKALTPNAEVEDVADAVKTEGRVAGQIAAVSHERPDTIVVGINDRDPRFHDYYTVDLSSGERTLLAESPGIDDKGIPGGFGLDDDYNVKHYFAITQEGGLRGYEWADGTAGDEVIDVPADDILTTSPAGYTKDGKSMFLLDSRGRNTGALYLVDLESGDKELIAENDKADLAGIVKHETKDMPEAVQFNYEKNEYEILDEEFGENFSAIKDELGDDVEISITSRSLDDKTWIVAENASDGPVKYHKFDADSNELTYLFSNRKALEDLPLQPMHPVVIKSRDDLNLVSYLTLPAGVETTGEGADMKADKASPMVLFVHGGPWARDEFGYNGAHQWLANRGYAVLSVNYRGSTGFGKDFINAGNGEWAGKMHDDLIDAVEWAKAQGIADDVAIMGGSYGGYATLVGVTFTPDEFVCGVDIVGPSNLVTLMNTIPPYWVAGRKLWQLRLGDADTEEGREFLMSRSPISKVDQIKVPLLIGQGANDPRVKQDESDQIVKAMQEKEIPVTYVLYPDEGHGFARPENRMSFYGVAEVFLANHLGGRSQPLTDADFDNSSITVPAGVDDVEGLETHLGN